MSLTLSATFSNSAAASRAVRLLRQSGVGVARIGRTAPTLAMQVGAFGEPLPPAGDPPMPHGLSLICPPNAPVVPARCDLSLSAEPNDLERVRGIVYRCGGVLR
jgi:hypothetical protein